MPCDVDPTIAELARRQHGVVTRAQLLERKVPAGAIDHRVEHDRLIAIHRGIYAAGHTTTRRRARVARVDPRGG